MEIDDWRNQIDEFDTQLLKLLAKRFELVHKIGQFKKKHSLPIIDKQRERTVLEHKLSEAKKLKLGSKFITQLFALIIKESRSLQK